MEFQAYPSLPKGRKSVVWQIQNAFHSSDSMALPIAILIVANAVVLYEQFTAKKHETDLRNFLAMIVVTMLPLAFLEKKVLACSDPVGALYKFSTKVLLMHLCFLALHVFHGVVAYNSPYKLGNGLGNSDPLFLIAACILLPVIFGFRLTRKCMSEHLDVCLIVLLACLAALITESLVHFPSWSDSDAWERFWRYQWSYKRRHLLEAIVESTMLYIELLAFVPAIWTVCRKSKDIVATKLEDVDETRKRAVCFFAFTISFYLFEDIIFGANQAWGLPLAQLGHLAHFALLLDFAGFLLAHLYDTDKLEKLLSPIMNLLADTCAV